jgi:hypothetical protein
MTHWHKKMQPLKKLFNKKKDTASVKLMDSLKGVKPSDI